MLEKLRPEVKASRLKIMVGPKQALVALLFALLLIGVMSVCLPQGVDWHLAFRPAALELASGRSPYRVEGFFNPPWALLPLVPIALLPENLGRAILTLAGILCFAFTAWRLGGQPLSTALFLLSPPVLHCLLNANIDWLAVLGFVLPPQIGLFFVTAKPQVGIMAVIYWLANAWRKGGMREVTRVFGPLLLATAASLVLFGPWPLRAGQEVSLWWNASLWPMSIPVGLVLLVAALRTRRIEFAMGASPCLSPYVLLHSWSGALIALVRSPLELTAATVGLWILVIIRATG